MGRRARHISQICLSLSLFFIGTVSLGAAPPCAELLGHGLPRIRPIILKPLLKLSDSPENLYEMKYDGFRGVAYLDKRVRCRFISRNGKELSQFKSLCEAIARELKVQNAIFDGEIIAPDPTGRPIFKKILRHDGPFQYVAFDLLWLNGNDLRLLPLESRRRQLEKLLPKSSRLIVESLAQAGSGMNLYKLMVQYDLEGIVVKRLDGKYLRSTRWYKFKNKNYSQAAGRRNFF